MTHTALITGASRGIGAATALALAQRGYDTVLAVRDAASAIATRQAIEQAGGQCRVITCDVADLASVQQAVRDAQAWHGRLDVVVNNAGQIDPIGHVGDTDPALWARNVTVNLVGAYHVTHTALDALLRVSGTVINLSSGAAHRPQEGWSAYCSAKAGLAMFTRCLAHEYSERGLVAYGLQPGRVDTEMQVRIRASGMNEISRVPREDLSPPRHAAQLIAWLAAERPLDLNGQDLTVRDAALLARAGLSAH